jgi:hypothetical protein
LLGSVLATKIEKTALGVGIDFPVHLHAGHWGDYSSLSVDPVDDCTFWYTTEYLKNRVNTSGKRMLRPSNSTIANNDDAGETVIGWQDTENSLSQHHKLRLDSVLLVDNIAVFAEASCDLGCKRPLLAHRGNSRISDQSPPPVLT